MRPFASPQVYTRTPGRGRPTAWWGCSCLSNACWSVTMGGVTDVIGRTGPTALARAVADHRSAVVEHRQAVQERLRVQRNVEQKVIDREVRATRHDLVRAVRRRWTADVRTLLDDDFLTVADRPTVYEAIVDAAVVLGRATGADLQVYDPDVGVLRIAAQRGFSREFLAYFATVDAAGPTACAKALATREPVLVDNVAAVRYSWAKPAWSRCSTPARAVCSPTRCSPPTVRCLASCRSTIAPRRPDRAERKPSCVAQLKR